MEEELKGLTKELRKKEEKDDDSQPVTTPDPDNKTASESAHEQGYSIDDQKNKSQDDSSQKDKKDADAKDSKIETN